MKHHRRSIILRVTLAICILLATKCTSFQPIAHTSAFPTATTTGRCVEYRYLGWLKKHNRGVAAACTPSSSASILLADSRNNNDGYAQEATDDGTRVDDDDGAAAASGTRIYFDIAVKDRNIGRLVFRMNDNNNDPGGLPLLTENVVNLCTEARRSIDPRCSYVGCEFKYSPQFIEGFAQYRWAHVLDGRGRNAVGGTAGDSRIADDPRKLRSCTHSLYGGVYYGMKYDELVVDDDEYNGVVLTVPLAGPFRGSTSLSIVRVGESPQEWKERLLLNSAVLGRLESGIETLRFMARQKMSPPTVVGSGKL